MYTFGQKVPKLNNNRLVYWSRLLNQKKSGEHPEKNLRRCYYLRWRPIKIWVDFTGYPWNHFSWFRLNGWMWAILVYMWCICKSGISKKLDKVSPNKSLCSPAASATSITDTHTVLKTCYWRACSEEWMNPTNWQWAKILSEVKGKAKTSSINGQIFKLVFRVETWKKNQGL